jgi:cytochrome b subunit of formate dehydrogenase
MTSIQKTRRITQTNHLPAFNDIDIERIKREVWARRLRKAQALAARRQTLPDGTLVFLRFERSQRYQHLVLLSAFSLLALTGLLQYFSEYAPVAITINLLGGIEGMRSIHHLAAIALIAVSLYHVWRILETWFVRRERGAMWPRVQDFKDLLQMVTYNLGQAQARPQFDRFSIEEKLEYWALLWGQVLMIVTGLIMWFPIVSTAVLPGSAVPISRALHGWEAILATLAILTWHLYHTQIKVRNRSIFTGYMTKEEMIHEHPLEYKRIMAAYEYVQRMTAGAAQNNSSSSSPSSKELPREPILTSEKA